MTIIAISNTGTVSLTGAATDVISIDYALDDHFGGEVVLDVSLTLQGGATVPSPTNTIVRLVWRDSVTNDELYRIDGIVGAIIENPASLLSRVDALEAFLRFDVTTRPTAFDTAVLASAAYNAPNTLGRNKVTLALPADVMPVFSADALFDALTTMRPQPSYLVLPKTDDLPVFVTAMRVADRLNIPLDADIDPTLTIDQVVAFAEGLDVRDYHVSLYWNPVLSRPRDAVSLRGAKKPRGIVGWLLGKKLLRNSNSNAQGVAPLADPIAGYDNPLPFKNMVMRSDVILTEDAQERLAQAKVNVVQPWLGSQGERFVVGDVLTQHDSKTSALRLNTSAEISMFTANGVIAIARRWMLTNTTTFLNNADRDCRAFLSACTSAGLLKPADDLDGQPWTIKLTPNAQRPFEAVDIELARRPEGCVRAVYFSDTLNK